jgi:hypothetical protein
MFNKVKKVIVLSLLAFFANGLCTYKLKVINSSTKDTVDFARGGSGTFYVTGHESEKIASGQTREYTIDVSDALWRSKGGAAYKKIDKPEIKDGDYVELKFLDRSLGHVFTVFRNLYDEKNDVLTIFINGEQVKVIKDISKSFGEIAKVSNNIGLEIEELRKRSERGKGDKRIAEFQKNISSELERFKRELDKRLYFGNFIKKYPFGETRYLDEIDYNKIDYKK